ncbi:MAG TPA: hypothetical protein VJA16_04900 [Thermoanaerobaculia bacterium]
MSRGGARGYGSGGSTRASGPVAGSQSIRAGGLVNGGTQVSTPQGFVYQNAGEPPPENRWLCQNPGGGLFYSFAGPCPDPIVEEDYFFLILVQVGGGQGGQGGQPPGYLNGREYATDVFPGYAPPGAGTPKAVDLPIQTRMSDQIAPYSVVLRDGMAYASVEPPRQVGNMVVARDRTGKLFSIKASEVDMGATRPITSNAASKPK